jgi:hypothetical protein
MSKGQKPKKPLSKATAALIEGLQRRRGVRRLAKRFLIVCEDDNLPEVQNPCSEVYLLVNAILDALP